MGKIGIIIAREYIMGVRNKTFIVMCFLAPLFFAGLIFLPGYLVQQSGSDRKVVVVDGTYEGAGCAHVMNYPVVFKDTMNLKFNLSYVAEPIAEVKKQFRDSSDYSVLYIDPHFMGACDTSDIGSYNLKSSLFSSVDPNPSDINYLKAQLTGVYREFIFVHDSVPEEVIEQTKKEVVINNVVRGVVSKSEVKAFTGLLFGMIIYIYILIFGVRVMRSVVEEKSTRIVEVIISSVRPFQLMLGKIVAVALVGLTQFAIWLLLSLAIVIPVMNQVNDQKIDFTQGRHNMTTGVVVNDEGPNMKFNVTQQTEEIIETIATIPWGNLIPAFLLFFVFGYLMYASVFAAVGSGVDTEADTSQFSVPVTVPLMIAAASSAAILNDPDGPIAKWLSMIPFTSPVAMLMRIPYGGVYMWELYTSLGILIASFLCMTWIAGRVYRVGILMYGKKNSWKELGKWLFYKG